MFGRQYHNLNIIEISSKKLVQNYHDLEKKFGAQIAPVLKSNAYGHGITLVAKILEKENPPFFCVDSLFEGYQLLKAGIKTKILIMGYTHPESLKVKKLPFCFVVSTLETLKTLQTFQPRAPIHFFVDTGMHREGFLVSELPEVTDVEGLMTHLATYKNPQQLENFKKVQEKITAKYIHPGNVWRIGIELYKNVLTFKSTIAQIKDLKKGEKVGYDFTYTAKKDMQIAVIPAGYNDGVDRKLSNVGYFLIKNKKCPIVGIVSMNITVIDVSNVKAKVGEQVIIYKSIEETAKEFNLFPYELYIHLNPTTKRILI